VGYNATVDFKAMADAMLPVINQWKNQAYGILIDPKKAKTVTNIQAGTRTVIQVPIGSGPMRIQPIKTDLTARNQTNDTTTRPVQFWLDFPDLGTIPDIYPGLEIVVTNGGNDPYSVNYQYSVTGAMNSSMAWQRTVNTITNMESRPSYQWAYLTGNINVAGSLASVQYESAPGAWSTYFTELIPAKVVHIPVFVGVNYRVTFSKQGYTSQTTASQTPVVFQSNDIGTITLV
jgi:hypothetical protein